MGGGRHHSLGPIWVHVDSSPKHQVSKLAEPGQVALMGVAIVLDLLGFGEVKLEHWANPLNDPLLASPLYQILDAFHYLRSDKMHSFEDLTIVSQQFVERCLGCSQA